MGTFGQLPDGKGESWRHDKTIEVAADVHDAYEVWTPSRVSESWSVSRQ